MGLVITKSGKGIAIDRTFLATPTKTSPSQFKIGTGTTAPTTSDTDIETAVAFDGASDYLKDFLSGYPTIDTANNQATSRMFVNTLEANGNSLSEVATFNTDATPTIFGRAVFTPITKTNLIEVTFIEKNRIV